MDNVVIFDVESTGVDTVKDEIIQIVDVKPDSKGNVRSKFEKFIKPSESVEASYHVHGFSDEFLKFIHNCIVVGHNVNYDINIFTSQLPRK